MEDFSKTNACNKEDGSDANIYTYFDRDINNMVDAHFIHALNQSRPQTSYYRKQNKVKFSCTRKSAQAQTIVVFIIVVP